MKKILTRIALALLLVAMVVTVVACNKPKEEDPTEAPTTVETPTNGPETPTDDPETPTQEPGGTEEVTYDEDYVDTQIDDVVPDPF